MAVGSEQVQQSIRDVLYVVFRQKWAIATFFIVAVTLVTVVTYATQETFRSEAKFLVRIGRENLSVDPSVSGPTVNPMSSFDSDVNSELSIFMSRDLAEQVVSKMGEAPFLKRPGSAEGAGQAEEGLARRVLHAGKGAVAQLLTALHLTSSLMPREKAIQRVIASRKGQIEKRTAIMSVSYDAPTPELAQQTLDNLVGLYMDHHIKVYASQASPQFFEAQTESLQKELERREKQLADFRNEHGISAMERQKEVLLQQVAALETQKNDLATQIGAGEARVASLKKTLDGRAAVREISRTTGRTNNAADALKESLADLRLKETDMAARYPATHRPLVELRRQTRQTEEALAQEDETLTEVTTGVDTSYQQLQLSLDTEQSQLMAHRASMEVLDAELAGQKQHLNVLASQEQELTTLTRGVELAEKEYRQYRDSLQRARISNAMDLDKVSNVSVVQRPTSPERPIKPRKSLNLAIGLFAGAVGALFLAFVREFLDDSIETEADVAKYLGAPVLALVSEKEFKACI